MFSNKNQQNPATKFLCKICDYSTSRKSNFDDHLLTAKHKMAMVGNDFGNDFQQNPATKYTCQYCSKTYKDNSGLWKHKNNSKCAINYSNISNNVCNKLNDKDVIMMLINDNKELRNLLIEQNKEKDEYKNIVLKVIENGTHYNNNSHNITTNSHNKAFNLNFFLNETCKDAMNITDFVESIKLQLTDLENVGEVGYVEGISNIIVSNLKKLDITKRPVHCTDKKRETMYIKDDNKWEKDEEKIKMHKLIKKVVAKNQRLLPKFKEEHPDCLQYHSKYSDQYSKIVYESMGGKGDNEFEKEEKIIKNIVKEVVVDKS